MNCKLRQYESRCLCTVCYTFSLWEGVICNNYTKYVYVYTVYSHLSCEKNKTVYITTHADPVISFYITTHADPVISFYILSEAFWFAVFENVWKCHWFGGLVWPSHNLSLSSIMEWPGWDLSPLVTELPISELMGTCQLRVIRCCCQVIWLPQQSPMTR